MSREGSPDWLRTFEVPKSVGSPSHNKRKGKSPEKGETVEEHVPQKKKKSDGSKKREGEPKAVVEKPLERNELNDSVLALSSDSEPENSPPREDDGESLDLKMSQLQSRGNSEDAAVMGISEASPSKQASKGKPLKKSPKGKGQSPKKEKNQMDSQEKEGISGDVEMAEKEASDKQIEPHISSSTLPLVLSEKVQRTKALVQCRKDSIDLSGDVGAVGRVIVSESKSGHGEMSLNLKGFNKGTTSGTLKVAGGLAAFMESRETRDHGNGQSSYKDDVQKFFVISRQSNLLYLGVGSASKCRSLAKELAIRVKISEFVGRHIAARGGETIKATVGIDNALQMAQERLNQMAHGNPRLGTLPNEQKFGGILIGQGPNKEYIAYFIALEKTRRMDPQRISDRPYFACGSGARFALQMLRDLIVNPQGTAVMAINNIKTTILFTCLNHPENGGKTYVFLLRDGHDLPVNVRVLDPVTVHLMDHEFLQDRIVLLIVAKKDAGEFDEIERKIGSWSGALCASRLASRKNFWVYRILHVDAHWANDSLNLLESNPVEPEKRDSDIPPTFGHYLAPLGDRAVAVYAGKCNRERLEFIKDW